MVAGPISSLEEGQSSDNADKFYYSKSPYYYWLNPQDDELWNTGTGDAPVKTDYDPCPTGWRVPTYEELRTLIQNHSVWPNIYNEDIGQSGTWYSGETTYSEDVPQVFFPNAGAREGDGIVYGRGYGGYYWSSTPHLSRADYVLSVCDSPNMHNDYRGVGHSVRCVQE